VTLLGSQTPTHLWVPPGVSTAAGREASDLARKSGLVMDEWQDLLLDGTLAESRPGCWQCFEAGWMVSRQNGKDAGIEAIELAGLFLFGEELIINSAHLSETTREHFFRLVAIIESNDWMSKRVRNMSSGKGAEEIMLWGPPRHRLTRGQRIKFMSRKGGSGRGFSGNRVIYNEAMYLDSLMIAASLPTMATFANPQVIYLGSAGWKDSSQFGLIRARGLAAIRDAAEGGEGDPDLFYAGWEAERPVYRGQGDERRLISGDDPADPKTWAKTNPGLTKRISIVYVRKEMRTMGGPESPTFWQERLGIGDWPAETEERWEVIGKDAWDVCRDPGVYDPVIDKMVYSQITDRLAFGVAAEEDGMSVIGSCGLTAEGRVQYEVVDRRPGKAWLADRIVELRDEHEPWAIIIRNTDAAASVLAALKKRKVKVESPSTAAYAQSCGAMKEDVTETGLAVHLGQASLRLAVASARKLPLKEGGWHWSGDTRPELKAVTLAKHGSSTAEDPVEPFAVAMGRSSELLPVGAVMDRAGEVHLTPAAGRGASGLAAARRGRP
jgi:hypothetical protein